LALGATLLGGFRSMLILAAILFTIQFCLEGLWRTRYLVILGGIGLLSLGLAATFASSLPLSIQRTLSFLPVDIDPGVRSDAMASTEWRLKMWQTLWPEIPRYLWLGKGYGMNESDLYLTQEAQRRGLAQDYESALIAGDYHSGPLSILVPFGLFGTLAFIAFCIAAIRALYRNFRYGDPKLRQVNGFLFAVFLTRFIFFWVIFGAIANDLAIFIGWVGLSVAINGGVASPQRTSVLSPTTTSARLVPV
jgi:O-antigen ligase